MDQRENQRQPLSICNRFYNSVMKCLSAHAFKVVILGRPMNQKSAIAQNKPASADKTDRAMNLAAHAEAPVNGMENPNGKDSCPFVMISSSCNDHDQQSEELLTTREYSANVSEAKDDIADSDGRNPEEEAPLSLVIHDTKAPKKTVSINETVEEIDTKKKKTRRKKSRQKPGAFDLEQLEEPRPLKSILKVASDSGERSSSIVNPSSGG